MGRRVRAFRKLKGYTQQQLADSVGISLAVLGAVERGNRRLEDKILNKIADVLGVSAEELANPSI
ncbi:transcriptional regulator with XRE-family HTH domain [Paenibacillus sp. PastF-1]|uniref:DNA-binding transcriptional regulator, XRE-family HTH domain n=2 Tax=Paenibacillus TaxID=44249 RepID=A0A1G8Z8J9_9BACL|nr:transcriptional regulator with XRE-family HTH domain [Paenibacillus sp. PastF-2]MDF9851293.1 transcriptional regulator with XRE-family HTH domain [Paenibacillus sp. PastM-2]MDF9857876.1 transcriptional regulator with XRE-family HTH domain [Paenibacillus sp. PastF-1]MDH6483097.1 transcriptional regulator with XRE-family HTH domain [Paenibacillus sp. PastH-2]MDH6510554.1 transcriptional regulator with XRE-family HTH domain [Paenibacillus sp. PastM-3]SDK11303.1 DNA-binding transcriptional regu